MKTSMQLPESVVREAKKLALEKGCTFRDLVLAGLRSQLREARSESVTSVVSRLRKGVDDGYWQKIGSDGYVAEQREGWREK